MAAGFKMADIFSSKIFEKKSFAHISFPGIPGKKKHLKTSILVRGTKRVKVELSFGNLGDDDFVAPHQIFNISFVFTPFILTL